MGEGLGKGREKSNECGVEEKEDGELVPKHYNKRVSYSYMQVTC